LSQYNHINWLHTDHEHGPNGCLTGDYADKPSYADLGITFNTELPYCPPDLLPPTDIPQVPLPGAVWLFLSALIGMVAFKRRR